MNLLKFDTLDSTNNYAKTLIREGRAKDGQIIYTAAQNAGRGQATNVWESEPGKNLTFSLIIQPNQIKPERQFLISQAVSVGILNYLKFLICKETIHIKWPNDIYVGMKKIAGILIEHSIQDNQILFSVIGIGLNINQAKFSKQAGNPISLSLILKEEFDLDIELDELTTCIVNVLDALQFDDGKECQLQYLQHLLFLNEECKYTVRGETITGKIIGVNAFGQLQIQDKNGTILEFGFKEIGYIL
ncbi:MAG: biotin--[acetyl-CoA-carboxylase] ligase [Bacteroidales bacterium]|jgi:BirA family biotin operon repressor/biotin-[acetyl-CoA-carboxylase] ligase|nr:biotin--[acetyl-CoA-carboxylase] ligase [Bacteroidales bacterium]